MLERSTKGKNRARGGAGGAAFKTGRLEEALLKRWHLSRDLKEEEIDHTDSEGWMSLQQVQLEQSPRPDLFQEQQGGLCSWKRVISRGWGGNRSWGEKVDSSWTMQVCRPHGRTWAFTLRQKGSCWGFRADEHPKSSQLAVNTDGH